MPYIVVHLVPVRVFASESPEEYHPGSQPGASEAAGQGQEELGPALAL